jgi:excisionase family DNA binding protein
MVQHDTTLDDSDRLLSLSEASRLQGLSVSTLRRFISDGRLKVVRPTPAGKAVRILMSELLAMRRLGSSRQTRHP